MSNISRGMGTFFNQIKPDRIAQWEHEKRCDQYQVGISMSFDQEVWTDFDQNFRYIALYVLDISDILVIVQCRF